MTGPAASMSASPRMAWVGAALLAGLGYFLIGRLFSLPSSHVHAWRVAAWLMSGVVFTAHIGYEHFTLRNPPRVTALHAAGGVAIGALALAVAGMIHSLSAAAGIRPAWLLALVIWPAATAVPAFLGALAAAAVLTHLGRRIGPG